MQLRKKTMLNVGRMSALATETNQIVTADGMGAGLAGASGARGDRCFFRRFASTSVGFPSFSYLDLERYLDRVPSWFSSTTL